MRKTSTFCYIFISIFATILNAQSICNKPKKLVVELEKITKKKCKNINKADLLAITELYLEKITTKDLRPNTFSELTNLKTLTLYSFDKKVQFIPPNVFLGLHNLKTLHIWKNELKTIKPHTFTGLTNLNSLSLSSGNLTSILPNAFTGLDNLKNLHLERIGIKTIDPKIFIGLKSLIDLSLRYNKITTLNSYSFSYLTNLETLDLNFSEKLTTIQDNAFYGLTNLKSLSLYVSKLQTINPKTFNGLVNLTDLQIGGSNTLTTIAPNAFSSLSSLKSLNLYGLKKLTKFDANVFNGLHNLNRLYLYELGISSYHSEIFNGLSKLQDLSIISGLEISLNVNTFNYLTNLKSLFLSYKENTSSISQLKNALGALCESSQQLKLNTTHIDIYDPTSPYYCRSLHNPDPELVWEQKGKSLLLSSFTLHDPKWISQMEEIIPEIHASLPKFWDKNNTTLNFFFRQIPLFSGNENELQFIRRLAIEICDLDTRYCNTRERIHQYPTTKELIETIDFFKKINQEKANETLISKTQTMKNSLSFLIEGALDFNFWMENLTLHFKPIVISLNVTYENNEQKLLNYSSMAILTRSIMDQLSEQDVISHGPTVAVFYSQLVREVKKLISEAKNIQNKHKVLISLVQLGQAERLLTSIQVNSLKKLVMKGDYSAFLNKYTTWAIERVNFDLGGSAKEPDSIFFDLYNEIVKTSILNEVEKVTNSL